jgi:hypothetical protein
MLSTPFMWLSSFSVMPRLKRCFALVVLPSVKLHGRVDVFVGRFTRPSQAGRFDALQRPRRTNHELVSRVLRSAFQRESKPSVLDHPSSLRRATYVAFIKVAAFRISLVLRISFVMRFHGVCVSRSSDGRFKGRPPLSAACPQFHLVSVAKFY